MRCRCSTLMWLWGGLQGSIVVASGRPRPPLLLLVRRCGLQVGELPSLPTCFRAYAAGPAAAGAGSW